MGKIYFRMVGEVSKVAPRVRENLPIGKLLNGGSFRRKPKNEILGFEIEGNLWKEKHNY